MKVGEGESVFDPFCGSIDHAQTHNESDLLRRAAFKICRHASGLPSARTSVNRELTGTRKIYDEFE